jgi:hypothetical protein
MYVQIYAVEFSLQFCDGGEEPCEASTLNLAPASDISLTGGETEIFSGGNRWNNLDGDPLMSEASSEGLNYYGGTTVTDTLGAGALSGFPSAVTFRWCGEAYGNDTYFQNIQLLSADDVLIAQHTSPVYMPPESFDNFSQVLTVSTPATADLSSTKIRYSINDDFFLSVNVHAVDMVVEIECEEEEPGDITGTGGILGGGIAPFGLRIATIASGGTRPGGLALVSGSVSNAIGGGLRASGGGIAVQVVNQSSGGGLRASGSAPITTFVIEPCQVALTVFSGSVAEDLDKFVLAVAIQLEDIETIILDSIHVVDVSEVRLPHQATLSGDVLQLRWKTDIKSASDTINYLRYNRLGE